METIEDPIPFFSEPVKIPVEMVGVRAVKSKWPVYVELVRLPNATKNIKENRIATSGTDFNVVPPEYKRVKQECFSV